MSVTHCSYVLSDAFKYSHIVFASATYNNGIFTPMEELLRDIAHHALQDRTVALIQNGSWAPASGKLMAQILGEMKNMELLEQTVTLKSALAPGQDQELEALAARKGIGAVIALLEQFDPDSARRLHPSDQKRIIRAAEVYLETGQTITAHNARTRALPPRHEALWLGLDFESRQDLYARIDQRAAQMMAQGLLDEVRRLLAQGISPRATAMQAIGYKECLATLDGAMTEAEALAQICQASRRYAKRQLTWFRRNPAVHWILQTAAPDAEKTFSQALQIVSAFDKP